MESALEGCPYDAILIGGRTIFKDAQSAMFSNGCDLSSTLLGTFDTHAAVYDAIAVGKLSFAISQQAFLQGTLSVVLASVYATTGNTIARSSEEDYGIYFSGPNIINIQNLPSDTLQKCEAESFPICGILDGSLSDEDIITINSSSKCPCTDRSKIKIAGVLHGGMFFWLVVTI
jgi:broad specificity polyphosphatase/5'/3'-nucleotidase SurE